MRLVITGSLGEARREDGSPRRPVPWPQRGAGALDRCAGPALRSDVASHASCTLTGPAESGPPEEPRRSCRACTDLPWEVARCHACYTVLVQGVT